MFELRHLRYFIAVAEELHFGRAAQRLHMAQPPLSQQIQALEKELKAPLLLRTKRSVALTEAGRIFLEEARAIVQRAAEAEKLVRQAAAGSLGTLRVGFVTSASYSLLPLAIREFRSRFPGVELALRESIPAEQVTALKSGELDVGILRLPVPCEDLETRPVMDEALVAALPSGHPLAGENPLTLSSLSAEPFVLFPRHHGPGLHDLILEACRQAGFVPRVVQQPNEMQALLAFVAGGLGVSLVPASLAGQLADRIVFRKLADASSCTRLAAIYPPGRSSPATMNFCKALEAAGEESRHRIESLLRVTPARETPPLL